MSVATGVVDESLRAQPSGALRSHIAWYSGYRTVGAPPGRHRGLPSPWLTFILTLDEPCEVAAHPDPRQPAGSFDTLLGGLHTRPATIVHGGRQSGVQLAVSPLGARALFGLPAGELAGIDLDASLVLGATAPELQERLQCASSWTDRFAVLDRLLTVRLRQDVEPDARVAYCWARLRAARGALRIGDLAAEVGWSTRHLSQRFGTEVGIGPKTAARVIRFDRARRLLQREPAGAAEGTVASVAAICGYYDQAHLAREFAALAGCSPSRWLAEEFRNVQAETSPVRASSLHDE